MKKENLDFLLKTTYSIAVVLKERLTKKVLEAEFEKNHYFGRFLFKIF